VGWEQNFIDCDSMKTSQLVLSLFKPGGRRPNLGKNGEKIVSIPPKDTDSGLTKFIFMFYNQRY